jgi:capsid protein
LALSGGDRDWCTAGGAALPLGARTIRVIVDAGREVQQNRADVEMGLKTLSDHFAELGADFGEEIERRVHSE